MIKGDELNWEREPHSKHKSPRGAVGKERETSHVQARPPSRISSDLLAT